MTYIVTSEYEINRVVAPRLPNATITYNQQAEDEYTRILRLYFNQLDNILGQLNSVNSVLPALTVYTVSTLPSAVTSGAGARAFVSDALAPTFGSTVVTGGAVKVPVYSDGTDWKVG
jgi:hypothetical protein